MDWLILQLPCHRAYFHLSGHFYMKMPATLMEKAAMEAVIREKFVALAPVRDERTRRLWAATEAKALGHGGPRKRPPSGANGWV